MTAAGVPREAVVWRVPLDVPDGQADRLGARLSPDERARAAAYAVERDRRRFVVSRGRLREILACELGADPTALAFEVGRHGKPRVAGLGFSLSRSAGLALVAVAPTPGVGVDLERCRDSLDVDQTARHAFGPAERRALDALPPASRRRGFFAGWTRKEALLKAWGTGLARPLDSFAVSLDPDAPAAFLSDAHDPSAPARWTLRDLDVGPGFAAAIALPGGGWSVALRDA